MSRTTGNGGTTAGGHNLFESLFTFHPRESRTPKENFLTEAFAYFLKKDENARNRWLSFLLGEEIGTAKCSIDTRATEQDPETGEHIYPDLRICGQLSGKETFTLYCEHKWDSPFDPKQWTRYERLTEQKKGKCTHLVFVGANPRQRQDAKKCSRSHLWKCVLWEDVYAELDGVLGKSTMGKEFLDFMKNHGLSPGEPITLQKMKAFLQGPSLIPLLKNLAEKLNNEYTWEEVPRRFRAGSSVEDVRGNGRVVIWFIAGGEYNPGPAITLGFLYDEKDHKVTLVNRDKGIDLLLRIEAHPKHTENIEPTLRVLREKKMKLSKTAASVLLKGEGGNGNPHSVLIVRDCLADVIGNAKTVDQQLDAIHSRLASWLQDLFKDGRLDRALIRSGLNSGVKNTRPAGQRKKGRGR